MSDKAPHEGMSARQYLATRLATLRPPMTAMPNPWRLVRMLDAQQWSFFAIAFLAWTWDAFDFFTVSLTVSQLAASFGRTKTDITWGITLVLMFRSVGAITFGIASDRYGRKWPFVVNNALFIVLELATGLCTNYEQFLACRALFGIAMGGLYGNVAATALEDCPEEARGLVSGLLQQGYAFGYLVCAAACRGLVDTTAHGWRPLFWFGAGPPVLLIVWRLRMPETAAYRERRRRRAEAAAAAAAVAATSPGAGPGRGSGPGPGPGVGAAFLAEARVTMRRHWLLLTYMVLLMAGFNFMAHGSQDLYPTRLKTEVGLDPDGVMVTQVTANLGAILGGLVVGFCSQAVGRRLSILACCALGAALLYPYCLVRTPAVMAGAFWEQFAVQGAWGVVPVHLMELSPGAVRTFVVGTSYQLGNLVSSASSTIEARLGERFPLPDGPLGKRYDYGRIIALFMGCVYAYLALLVLLGPERLCRRFDDDEGGEGGDEAKEGEGEGEGDDGDKPQLRTTERARVQTV